MQPDLMTTEIHWTKADDRIISLLVGFGPARRAVGVWRFSHRMVDDLHLRIFSDGEGLPIAVEFYSANELPKSNADSSITESPETAIQKLYGFALSMIEYGQIEHGAKMIEDATSGLEFPSPQIAKSNLRRAQILGKDLQLAS